jgi:hypothetical protein
LVPVVEARALTVNPLLRHSHAEIADDAHELIYTRV